MSEGRIEMRLHASLLKWKNTPAARYELGRAKTVKDWLAENAIPERDVAIIIINGKRGTPDSVLRDGDTLSLFPLIGGG